MPKRNYSSILYSELAPPTSKQDTPNIKETKSKTDQILKLVRNC